MVRGWQGCCALAVTLQPITAAGPTVEDVIAAFWIHAQRYYRKVTGEPTPELQSFHDVLRLLRRMFGTTQAVKFGPLSLEACQTEMIRLNLSRKTINRRTGRIRHVFKWAVSQEMLPSSVYEALRTVAGIKRGRTEARETKPVAPVSDARVKAVIAQAGRQIAAMIELQAVTGMRSGEMVIMRTGDIDRAGKVWTYTPSTHKTEHHGHTRTVYLGARAQEIATPFLKLDPTVYLFSPTEADAERRAALSAKRKTPLSCGNRPGTNCSTSPKKKPGERYRVVTYARAVTVACDKAFPVPAEITDPIEVKAWKKSQRFHPHQLRHTAATKFRRDSGIETARVLLGQKSIQAVEIYAEQDMTRAREFMERVW